MAETFAEFVSLREIAPGSYETNHNPGNMGNMANIAYGGCALAVAVNAAYQNMSPNYHLYSVLGYYLGPALTTDKLHCSVTNIRNTRTFTTRRVEVSQRQGTGYDYRLVLVLMADFQTPEPASALVYSASPILKYSSAEQSPTQNEIYENMIAKGKITQSLADQHQRMFELGRRYFELRTCEEGMFGQKLSGVAKHLPTSQDERPFPERTSADWMRSPRHLLGRDNKKDGQTLQCTALTFAMDGALSFLPLTHSHQFLDDVTACSSLDFAFRLFSNNIDFTQWHLREMTTSAGAVGRTFSESRLWDVDGNMVASMTQQSILRPKKKDTDSKASL